MLSKSRPEQVKTELGAVALCVASVVAFLTATTAFKQNFSTFEFWVFINSGMAWFTWVTLRVLNLHTMRAELEEQRNFLSSHHKIVDAQQETIRIQTENLKVLNETARIMCQECKIAHNDPNTKEQPGNDKQKDKDDVFDAKAHNSPE